MKLTPGFFLLCGLVLFSCSDKSHKPDAWQKKASVVNRVNHGLPFGNPLLGRYKNQQRWSTPLDDDTIKTPNPHQIQYRKIADSYYALTQTKSIKPPDIKEVAYFKIGSDSLICKDDKHFYGDFKYRLPNTGPYECYYQTGSFYNRQGKAQQTLLNGCMDYGNIVLLSPKTKKAIVVNVYYSHSAELIYFMRIFYVNKDSSIDIYESSEFESETTIKKAFKVTIDKAGRVIVKGV